MSAILNSIKSIVNKGVSVDVSGTPQYGKHPVVVKDTTNSTTSGWELLYRVEPSKFNGKARESYGHFSELRIPNFNNFYSLIQQVYSQFKQGVNVERKYDTNFATYQPNENLWFTALDRKGGTSITITVTDDASPFHMLYLNFFITMSNQNQQPYMIGYDKCFDQTTGVYTEKMNAFMLPRKKRFVPVFKHQNGSSTIKAQGFVNQEGLVQINENQTEVVYVQEMSNERKFLAGIYEKSIIEFVLEKTDEFFKANQNNQQAQPAVNNNFQQGFGQPSDNQNVNVFETNQQQASAPANNPGGNVFAAWLGADTSNVF